MTVILTWTTCWHRLVSASAALERLEGIRRLSSDTRTDPWLTGLGIAAIVVLLGILVLVNRLQKKARVKPSGQLFAEYAQQRGLTERETALLWDVAAKAGLQHPESVFTLPTAYDRGEVKLAQACLIEQGGDESERLQVDLSFLREKMGFHTHNRIQSFAEANPEDLDSRQIPVGKKLYIRHHRATGAGDMESIVVNTSAAELTVELDRPVEVAFGQTWRCRYYSGASLWEFDTTVCSCSGRVVSLQHSDQVRLINRRKFLRVPVKRRAVIAAFPFSRSAAATGPWPRKKKDLLNGTVAAPVDLLTPPAFVPATVTELGGPGLRITADLEVKINDRVLILFYLTPPAAATDETGQSLADATADKVIQSPAAVRHIRAIEGPSRSIALELIGLDDDDIDELIRTTNELSIESRNQQNKPAPAVEMADLVAQA